MARAAVAAAVTTTALQQAVVESQQLLPALQQLAQSFSAGCRAHDAAAHAHAEEAHTAPLAAPSSSEPRQHPRALLAGARDVCGRWPPSTLTHGAASRDLDDEGSRGGAAAGRSGGRGSGASGSGSSGASGSGRLASSPPADAPPPPPPQEVDPLSAALLVLQQASRSSRLTPRTIVQQLDKHIVGQADAKRAVAVALRNRWRRHKLPADVAEEITPKNILMIGPTGCGKTEIARRLAQLVEAPFIKVEATKFTELGFVGRDVDEIVKDLVEASLSLMRARLADALREQAAAAAEEAILAALTGYAEDGGAMEPFRRSYREGALDNATVHLDLDALGVSGAGGGPGGGGTGQASHPLAALTALMDAMQGRPARGPGGGRGGGGGGGGGKTGMKVSEARRLLVDGEIERCLASDRIVREALRAAENDGIVFIDEIDKIVDTSRGAGGATSSNVSSEGVQRDLLPILEGSVVQTKYGNVSTDHVLFIASGAFHSSKPSDMLAELQGRLPVRVELQGLTADDFYRILTEPQHNMVRQQQALLATEGVDLAFEDASLRAIAGAAEAANRLLDNIGARRLSTVLERVLADISFAAPDRVARARQERQEQEEQEQREQQQREAGRVRPGAEAAPLAVAAAAAEQPDAKAPKGRAQGGGRAGGKSPAGQGGSSAAKSRGDPASGGGSAGGSGVEPASGGASSTTATTSSSSGSGSGGSGTSSDLLVQYVVTEEMVQSCMQEVLKQKDLSRYVL